MVNLVDTERSMTLSSSSSPPSSSLFNLSKPANLFLANLSQAKNLKLAMPTSNTLHHQAVEDITFDFLAPMESTRHTSSSSRTNGVSSTYVSKMSHTSVSLSARSQPYTLSKPEPPVNNQTSLVPTTTSTSGSNNAILSRLSSLSGTLKSIFVRPKNSKHVQIQNINTTSNSNAGNSGTTAGPATSHPKIKLFSTNSSSDMDVTVEKTNSLGNDLNTRIEKIISRNIMNESSSSTASTGQQRLLKSNLASTGPSSTSGATSSNVNSPPTSSSSSTTSTASNVSTLSTTSNITLFTNTDSTGNHHKPRSTGPVNSYLVNQSMNMSSNQQQTQQAPAPKWTCLVCLSKHRLEVKACTICGSLQPSSKPNTSSTVLGNSSNALKAVNHNNSLNSSVQMAKSALKTWICSYCTFANDSLKIVCMNCRSAKQKADLAGGEKVSGLKYQTLQTKRARGGTSHNVTIANASSMSSTLPRLNTSNEENEPKEERVAKKSRQNQSHDEKEHFCTNCKSHLHESSTNTKGHLNGIKSVEAAQLVTPTKPANLLCDNSILESTIIAPKTSTVSVSAKSPPPVASTPLVFKTVSNNTEPKWTCDTCLIKNESSVSKCVACATPKPGSSGQDQIDKPTTDKIESTKPSISFGLQAPLSSTISSAGSKWSCSTCLVSNDSDKEQCVCCMTARDKKQASGGQTKFSEVVAAAGHVDLFGAKNSASTTIAPLPAGVSFGLSNNSSSSQPISFGSSNFMSGSSSNTGFKLGGTSETKPTEIKKDTTPTPTFTLGATSTVQPTTVTPTISFGASSTSSFSFGAPIQPSITTPAPAAPVASSVVSSTPMFGSSNTNTASTFSFGSSTASSSFAPANPPSTPAPATPSFGSTNQPTSFNFGNSGSTTTTTTTNNSSSSNPPTTFAFGSLSSNTSTGLTNPFSSTPAPPASSSSSTSVFGSSSNTFSFNKPATQAVVPPAAPTQSATSSFGFGSFTTTSSNNNTTSSNVGLFGSSTFGNSSNSTTTSNTSAAPSFNVFGAKPTSTSAPTFSNTSFSSSSTTSSFGLKQETSSTSSTATPSFGAFSNSTGFGGFGSNKENAMNSDTMTETTTASTDNKKNGTLDKFFFKKTTNTPTTSSTSSTAAPAPSTPSSSQTSLFGAKQETTASSVFGSLSQSKSTFAFGASNTASPATNSSSATSVFGSGTNTFTFGASNTQTANNTAPAAAKPFVFGGAESSSSSSQFNFGGQQQSSTSAFSFGNSNNNDGMLMATPNKNDQVGTGLSGFTTSSQTPSASTPFVFGGSTETPSALQQVLGGTPTTGQRPYKKPTRRIKK